MESPNGITSHLKDPARSKCGFPFVFFLDVDKVVGVSEVKHSIDASFSGRLEKVRDEQKWIPIFLRDFVKTAEIDTEAEGAILFTDEKNGGTMWRGGGSDKTTGQMFINEFTEGLKLSLREQEDRTYRRFSSIFKVDLEVVRMVRR